MANTDNPGDYYALYRYDPSLAAAVVFVICFVLITSLHTFHMIKTRTWIVIPLVVGGFFEWIGYLCRAISSKETPDWSLGPFIIQSLLILVAPALFAASIYMLLSRIILAVDGFNTALIKQKWLTKIFVCGDIFSFLLQGSGGGLMSSGDSQMLSLGNTIIIVGLFVQLAMFGFFVVVAVHFHVKFGRHGSKSPFDDHQAVPWRRHLFTLYTVSGLVVIRSVFRVIEYVMGNDGYLMQHEVYLYIFDAVLMLLVMVALYAVHPSEITAHLRRAKLSSQQGHHPLTVRV